MADDSAGTWMARHSTVVVRTIGPGWLGGRRSVRVGRPRAAAAAGGRAVRWRTRASAQPRPRGARGARALPAGPGSNKHPATRAHKPGPQACPAARVPTLPPVVASAKIQNAPGPGLLAGGMLRLACSCGACRAKGRGSHANPTQEAEDRTFESLSLLAASLEVGTRRAKRSRRCMLHSRPARFAPPDWNRQYIE